MEWFYLLLNLPLPPSRAALMGTQTAPKQHNLLAAALHKASLDVLTTFVVFSTDGQGFVTDGWLTSRQSFFRSLPKKKRPDWDRKRKR